MLEITISSAVEKIRREETGTRDWWIYRPRRWYRLNGLSVFLCCNNFMGL